MASEELRKRRDSIHRGINLITDEMDIAREEVHRSVEILHNTREILDDLDRQFCEKTKLNTLDVSILFVAIGLQIARQYLLTKFPQRLDDQTAARNTFGQNDKNIGRSHRLYHPSLEEILNNPVPFDANVGSDGALKGYGSFGHRGATIGHDPLLGLIFGTANIATSTLTTSNFYSYHIYTGVLNYDTFKSKARTDLVLSHTMNKLLSQSLEGKKIVACSLMKEIIHLNSDMHTKRSLPLPVISTLDPLLASNLAKYGLDMSNVLTVLKQSSYAAMINMLIAMFHRMFCPEGTEMEQKLYEVKTRKVLSYSNLVASSSNLAVVAITRDFKLLDLGGLAVTIYRLITDIKFIRQVKHDFIFGSYKDYFLGDYE